MKKDPIKAIVQGQPELVRDIESQAIINTNDDAFRAARARKHAVLQQQNSHMAALNRISTLETTVAELKALILAVTKG
jgi:hypothetical protein